MMSVYDAARMGHENIRRAKRKEIKKEIHRLKKLLSWDKEYLDMVEMMGGPALSPEDQKAWEDKTKDEIKALEERLRKYQ
jgi:hypothetical protein